MGEFPAEATGVLDAFVDITVAVVVFSVADLLRCGSADTARVERQTVVDHVVTVVVDLVADLRRGVAEAAPTRNVVDLAVAVVVDVATLQMTRQGFTFARTPAHGDVIASLLSGAAGAHVDGTFRSGVAGAGCAEHAGFLAHVSVRALLVDFVVAVVVDAVADLDARDDLIFAGTPFAVLAALLTSMARADVHRTVWAVVAALQRFDVVDDAVAVVVLAVACFVFRDACLHVAGDATVVVAHLEPLTLTRPETLLAGGTETNVLIHIAVAVVVDVVAQLVLGACGSDTLAVPLPIRTRFRAERACADVNAAFPGCPVLADVSFDALAPVLPASALAESASRTRAVESAGVIHLAVAVTADVGIRALAPLFPLAVDARTRLGTSEVEAAVAGLVVAVVADVGIHALVPIVPAPVLADAILGADAVEAAGAEIALAILAGGSFDAEPESSRPLPICADHLL